MIVNDFSVAAANGSGWPSEGTNSTELSTDLSTAAGPAEAPTVLQVAVNAPLRRVFDYLPPADRQGRAIPPGTRVRVSLGARQVVGMVVAPASASAPTTPALGAQRPAQLKTIQQVIDAEPLLTAPLLQLLQWVAAYYHHPLGEVIAAALPRGLREGAPAAAPPRTLQRWRVTAEGAAAALEGLAARAPAQRTLLGLLAERPEGLSATELTQQQPGWQRPARLLERRGWVAMEQCLEGDPPQTSGSAPALSAGAPRLSGPQADAVATIDA